MKHIFVGGELMKIKSAHNKWKQSIKTRCDHLHNSPLHSIRVLPERLRFYPEPFASEKPLFKERVPQGFFIKTKGSIKNTFHPKNPFWKKEFFKDC